MLVLFIVLQIYLKTLEELLYFYQEVKKKLIKFQGYLSKWIFIETNNEKDMKYLYISTIELKKIILDKLSTFSYGLLIPKTRLKSGRSIGSKDKDSWMRKGAKKQDDLLENLKIPKNSFHIINDLVLEEPQVLEIVQNDEISINYVMNHIIWNQNEVNIDKTLTYNIMMNVMNDNEDQ